jgi:TP901 family phage tail tape measure protein
MADAQSNIKISIDTTGALASIKNLQRQISAFHTSIAKSGAAANAVSAQMQQSLVNSINATGKFSAQMKTIRTTTESFTNSLEKNKFSLGEYFRYAGGASKSFGRLFKSEFETINKVARENVKDLQTQYIKMGRDANGSMKAIAVRPLSLDMNDLATKTMIASEKQALLNQLLKQGSTNLLNFGKNTQWAGRQLMVGFTIPLVTLGSAASKTFMEMETQALRFKKVYGDLFTPKAETQQALDEIKNLGKEFTKYGIAVSDTVALASEAAAAGFKGLDLQRQTSAATKLSILGQVDNQKALETTIALQNAFSMSSADLASNIDFLNAVENQTVLSLDDVSTAIPKAGPVVQQLGGDVRDLAFFMTAMKEGGINASEGANALKSGLASLINPTGKANAMLEGFGINVKKIVVDNKGDLKKTVVDFATALNKLDPLNRAQAIEQMFGKFQFARLSTLFANVTKEGTQASRVMDLAGASVQELASLSEKELGMTADSAMNKFKSAVENLKLSLVPVGEEFLKAVTPIAQFVSGILDKFNNLGSGTKKTIVLLTTIIAGLGPVLLMTFGLLANGIANIIKGFTAVKTLFNKTGQSSATLGTEVKYMTTEQRNAAAVAASLDQVHRNLAQVFTAEAAAVDKLTAAYGRAITAQNLFMPTRAPMKRTPKKRADGKPAVVGGTGNKDSELALLMPGETVIPTKMSEKYGSLINGMIADNIPGYRKGLGTGTAVDIPGGFAAAHFGGSAYRTGTELLGMVEGLDTAFARQIRTMVAEVEGGLDRVFTVFSNEVIGTSTELNRAVGKTGSGKTASMELAKRDLIGSGAATRDIELQRQLEAAGVSIEDIRKINKNVTDKIKVGFDKLGNKAIVTAEDLDKLVNDAYSEVSKTDDRVKSATERMRNITAVTDPRNDSRVAVSKDPYTKHRKSGAYYAGMERAAGTENVPYQKNARFKITNAMADSIGLSSSDTAAIYNEMNDQAKIALAKLKGDVAKFTLEFEKQATAAGLKIGNSYKIGVSKSGLQDIYVQSRKRNSPHRLAPKDGTDDGRAYSIAVQKSIDRQNRKLAKRAKYLNPNVADQSMSVISGTSKKQNLLAKAKTVGGKFGRLGGGMGLIGANMAMSAMPDFAGKGIAQSALTGGSFGLMFGPQAAAAGAAIGLVTSALTTLIAKEKEHAAVVKATFTPSADIITQLGDRVLDTKLKIVNLGTSTKNIGSAFGIVSPEIQKMVDAIKALPEDDPLSKFIKNISSSKSDLTSVTGSIRSQVTSAIATGGLDPKNAEKYVQALLAAAGRTKDFGSVWKSVSKDVVDAQTATATSLDKTYGLVKKTNVIFNENMSATSMAALNYNDLTSAQEVFADQMLNIFSITSNGSLNFDQMSERIKGVALSSINAKVGVIGLTAAINNSGNADAIARLGRIKEMYKNAGKEAELTASKILMVNSVLQVTGEDAVQDWARKQGFRRISPARQIELYFKSKDFKDAYTATQEVLKSLQVTTDPYQDPTTDGKAKSAKDKYLDILDKEIQALKDKRDAQKNANDETQRQIDLENKMQDLANQAVQAKISGNYIQAAALGQQAKNAQMEFNKETEIRKQDAAIDILEKRKRAIEGGAPLTQTEKDKLSNKKTTTKKKKTMGPIAAGAANAKTPKYAGGNSVGISTSEWVGPVPMNPYKVAAMDKRDNDTAVSGSTVYNINMPVTSNKSDPKEVAEYVMNKLKVELIKNNKSNAVAP